MADVIPVQNVKNMLIINSFYLPGQPIVCKLHLYFISQPTPVYFFMDIAVPDFSFINSFSFGYLIKRSGDFYEKNTMRIGIGQASLFKNKINIEPVIYYNNTN